MKDLPLLYICFFGLIMIQYKNVNKVDGVSKVKKIDIDNVKKADQLIIGEQRKSAKGCSTATIPPFS